MNPKPDKIIPALYGGIIMALVSTIPFVSFINCLCCAGIMLGGLLAFAGRIANSVDVRRAYRLQIFVDFHRAMVEIDLRGMGIQRRNIRRPSGGQQHLIGGKCFCATADIAFDGFVAADSRYFHVGLDHNACFGGGFQQ